VAGWGKEKMGLVGEMGYLFAVCGIRHCWWIELLIKKYGLIFI
jgi:hypothetical protein